MITYNGTYDDERLMLFTDSVTGSTFSVPSGSGIDELEAVLMAVRERFAFAAETIIPLQLSENSKSRIKQKITNLRLKQTGIEMMRCPICLTWLSYIMDSHGIVNLPVRWVVCRQCEKGGE